MFSNKLKLKTIFKVLKQRKNYQFLLSKHFYYFYFILQLFLPDAHHHIHIQCMRPAMQCTCALTHVSGVLPPFH